MSTLKKALIELGYQDPDLRDPIREILSHMEVSPKKVKTSGAMDVAKIILEQMGGKRRLQGFLGATQFNLLQSPDGVGIKWPNKKRSLGNYVRITLTPQDTYDMEFQNVSTRGVKTVKTYKGLFFDMLVSTFEGHTGWYLH
jgi:hypothetical protein